MKTNAGLKAATVQYAKTRPVFEQYKACLLYTSPMALKADFILSLMELIVGGKDGLQPVERTVIDPVSYTHLDVYKRQGLWWRDSMNR